ncbi:MAG TPA: sialidase family protein, partial [Candidatus Kapabacteria bacterium]
MKYLLFAFFVFISFTVDAQELSIPINISNQTGTERPPIMHVGNDGTIFITWIRPDITGGVIFIAHSTDGGKTFSAP